MQNESFGYHRQMKAMFIFWDDRQRFDECLERCRVQYRIRYWALLSSRMRRATAKILHNLVVVVSLLKKQVDSFFFWQSVQLFFFDARPFENLD